MKIGQNSNRYISYKEIVRRLIEEFNVTLQEHVILQHIHDALKDIETIATLDFLYFAKVEDFKVKAPCNLYHIKSITYNTNEYDYSLFPYYYQDLSILPLIEEYYSPTGIYYEKAYNYIKAPRGHYVDYTWYDDYIKFNVNNIHVIIEYTGIYTDEEGYPMIFEDWALAVLYYVASKHDFAKLRAGMIDPAIYQETLRIYNQEKNKAKTPLYNRNRLNKALDVLYSNDRKSFLLGK